MRCAHSSTVLYCQSEHRLQGSHSCIIKPGAYELQHATTRSWMTVLAATGVAKFSVFGLADVPMWLTPFASLALTSAIIPRSSFVGHASGIVVGFMVSCCLCCLACTGIMQYGSDISACKTILERALHSFQHDGGLDHACAAAGLMLVLVLKVAGGLFDWLTLFWLLSLSAWIAALLAFHAVSSGRLQLSWLRMLPPEGGEVDIEMGAQPVRAVVGVLERQ